MTTFYRVEVPTPHEDARRIITDCVLDMDIPFAVRQIKIIDFKARGMEVQEREMRAGDACYVPPPYSHSFRVEHPAAKLWGLANQAYDATHDVPDKLF